MDEKETRLNSEIAKLERKRQRTRIEIPASASDQFTKLFGQFLGEPFDATAMRNEEILEPSNMRKLPRQGLVGIIGNMWAEINSQLRPEPQPQYALAGTRKPLLFVHSSPGCRKTYLLRELARKLPHNCKKFTKSGIKIIKNIVVFVGISFNSSTPIG